MKTAMKPPAHIIDWRLLFERNGKPKNKETIIESLHAHALPCDTINCFFTSCPSGIYLLSTEDNHLRMGTSGKYLWNAFSQQIEGLKGSASKAKAVIVSMPPRLAKASWRHMHSIYIQKQIENPIGKKLLEQKLPDDVLLKSCLDEASFYPLYSRNRQNQKGSLVSHPIRSVRGDSTGLYFIREHAPGDSTGEIVYVGLSHSTLKRTLKNHFATLRQPIDEQRSRGELRGDWVRKVKEQGYEYYAAPIAITPPLSRSKRYAFKKKISSLETRYINLLLPRDNEDQKPDPAQDSDPF